MFLIFPPAAKLSEPPAGILKLADSLRSSGVPVTLWDANLEIFHHILSRPDRRKRSNAATLNRQASVYLRRLKSKDLYQNPQAYRKVVVSLNQLLSLKMPPGVEYSLSNYGEEDSSPLSSSDCIRRMENSSRGPFTSFFREVLISRYQEENTVGISLQFMNQVLPAMDLIGLLLHEFPKKKILIGGGLITSWTRIGYSLDFLKKTGCRIVSGPGEETLLDLYSVKITGKKEISLHNLAEENYLAPTRILPVSFSTGCCYRKCTFCPETAEESVYSAEDPAEILPILQHTVRREKIGLVHILDNEISPRFLKSLTQTPPGSPWYGFTRFYPLLLDRIFCQKLADTGCRMLKLGLESGNRKVLETLGKGIVPEDAEIILKNLHEAGILTYVYVMFGTPAENRQRAEDTRQFLVQNAEKIDFLNLAIFNLPIRSPLHDTVETRPFYTGDLSLYEDFVHPEDWNRREVRRWLSESLRKTPELQPILQRTPPVFNANHAPFFLINNH